MINLCGVTPWETLHLLDTIPLRYSCNPTTVLFRLKVRYYPSRHLFRSEGHKLLKWPGVVSESLLGCFGCRQWFMGISEVFEWTWWTGVRRFAVSCYFASSVLCPLGELVKRDSELGTGIRGGQLLKCRQECMVSEFVANEFTKVKVNEERSYRMGASNS
jgi:hypothetical protein